MNQNPHQDLLDEIPGHPPTSECDNSECMVCGVRDCRFQEPLHHHHDGCPACCQYICPHDSMLWECGQPECVVRWVMEL